MAIADSKIEVELRGVLSKEKFVELQEYLEKFSNRFYNDDKLTYFFVTDGFIFKITDCKNKGQAIITVKKGDETKNILEEFELNINKNEIDKAVYIFNNLGFNKINKVEQKRTNYKINDFWLSLKYTQDWGYHFEIEAIAKDLKEAKSLKKKLNMECERLEIHPMTAKEIKEKILTINKKHGFIK